MASKAQAPEEPTKKPIATIHLGDDGLEMGAFVGILQAISQRFPHAILGNEEGDPKRVQVLIPPRSEPTAEEGADDRSTKAAKLLAAIVHEDKFSGMIDSAEESGMLTTDEAADLRRVEEEAETFLGFLGSEP